MKTALPLSIVGQEKANPVLAASFLARDASTQHPSREAWIAFSWERGPVNNRRAMTEHLRLCGSCRDMLLQLPPPPFYRCGRPLSRFPTPAQRDSVVQMLCAADRLLELPAAQEGGLYTAIQETPESEIVTVPYAGGDSIAVRWMGRDLRVRFLLDESADGDACTGPGFALAALLFGMDIPLSWFDPAIYDEYRWPPVLDPGANSPTGYCTVAGAASTRAVLLRTIPVAAVMAFDPPTGPSASLWKRLRDEFLQDRIDRSAGLE